MRPAVVHDVGELRDTVRRWRSEGLRVALVPTMGCLHKGHLALVDAAGEAADRVIVSIFVNPLQFSAGEDLERYPRTLDADCDALATVPCDAVFAPDEASLYPKGRDGLTEVRVPEVSSRHCGAFRPGHFEGVTTVVNILFNLVQPDLAVFGEKDCQQLFVIRRMVGDLHMPIQIIGVPTVREPDGLAMSSRNRYLDPGARALASRFPQALDQLATELSTDTGVDLPAACQKARASLEQAGLTVQYIDVVDENFCLIDQMIPGQMHILAAVEVGAARLIDNRRLTIPAGPD